MGALHQTSTSWGTLQIHTPGEHGGKSFDIQAGVGYPFSTTEGWAPTIWAYQKMVELPSRAGDPYAGMYKKRFG